MKGVSELWGLSLSLSFFFGCAGSSLGLPYGSAGKESACSVEDLRLIPGLGRSPGKGKGYPLQYSALENSMDCIVHGVCARVFSSYRERGLHSSRNALVSHRGGFSCRGA